MLWHFKSQIYLTHNVSVVLFCIFFVQLWGPIFVLFGPVILFNIHHGDSPLFKLGLQCCSHLSLVFISRTGVLVLRLESCFTIHFEVVHQLRLHLLLTLLFILALNYFLLHILHDYFSFKDFSLLPLVFGITLFHWDLVFEIIVYVVWFDKRDRLAILVWLSNVVFVLLSFLFVINSIELTSYMIQSWLLV